MATTFTLIQTYTLGSAAASIDFTAIPATYTDLCLKFSIRTNDAGTDDILLATVNSISTGYSNRILYGDGSAAGSLSDHYSTAKAFIGYVVGNGSTASTFGNGETYFPNYAGSTYKSWSSDSVNERNSTSIVMGLAAGLLSNNAVISGLSLVSNSGATLLTYSTASLYGILKA